MTPREFQERLEAAHPGKYIFESMQISLPFSNRFQGYTTFATRKEVYVNSSFVTLPPTSLVRTYSADFILCEGEVLKQIDGSLK